ncbi:hypothetical protein SKAU_G00200620 [Synaphobranchus kaupii]|uniref:Uncharacterized protein n=1 Tax=Synaphobranchus kaupii TaxID=118154 RepID=A0A9Q1FFV5_SYNKA|nr:hypothetical protein SKAU_G00200620 [Synaphobranchus kaupii]
MWSCCVIKYIYVNTGKKKEIYGGQHGGRGARGRRLFQLATRLDYWRVTKRGGRSHHKTITTI